MRQRDVNRMEAFRRAGAFGLARPAAFPPARPSGKTFAALAALAAKIQGSEVDQRTGTEGEHGASASAGVLYDALHKDLFAISATAQIVDEEQPGFAKLFLLPTRDNAEAHLTAARTVLRALDPTGGDETGEPFDPAPTAAEITAAADRLQTFRDEELPADFLEHLRTDTAALAGKRTQGGELGEDHVGATAGLSADVREGLKLVRRADRMVKNKLGNDPEELARWTTASHIQRVPVAVKKPAPPVTP